MQFDRRVNYSIDNIERSIVADNPINNKYSDNQKKKLYGENFNLEFKGEEVVATQKVQVSFFKVGETSIELLLPTAADSPVAKFLENKGEGFHHMALEVEDIDSAVEELKAAGVRLIDETPREGAHGTRVAFIHPKSTFGLLLELVQYP